MAGAVTVLVGLLLDDAASVAALDEELASAVEETAPALDEELALTLEEPAPTGVAALLPLDEHAVATSATAAAVTVARSITSDFIERVDTFPPWRYRQMEKP